MLSFIDRSLTLIEKTAVEVTGVNENNNSVKVKFRAAKYLLHL